MSIQSQIVKSDSDKSSSAGVNLLVDGSFETAKVGAGEWSTFSSVGGWKSDTGVKVWGKGVITKASDGDKVIELVEDNGFNRGGQDVKTEAGAEYTFKFDYAMRPDTKAATNTIEVWWNGEFVGKVEPSSTGWSHASFTVKGTGGTDRIEFREEAGDNDSYGGVIDNVSLFRPEHLVLNAATGAETGLGEEYVGTTKEDKLDGHHLGDTIIARGGKDVVVGSDARGSRVALEIDAHLDGATDPSAISITIHGVPADAELSAGVRNGDGSWSLTLDDLKGLSVEAPDGSDFTLTVIAKATDGSGLVGETELQVTTGSSGDNVLSGGLGDDVIYGSEAGNDFIYGGGIPTGVSRPDYVPKDSDNDVIHAGNGRVHVRGQAGNDEIWAGSGTGWYSGGKDDDTIHAGAGSNEIHGNSGNDVLVTGGGKGQLYGESGDDHFLVADAGTY